MRTSIVLAALLLGGFSMAAEAGCDYPALLMIPAKDKFSKKETKKINSDAEKYFADMKKYVSCVQAELQAAGGDSAPKLFRNVLVARNNAAVAEFEAVEKWYTTSMGVAQPEGPRKDQAEGSK
jgi:hypothetical protein